MDNTTARVRLGDFSFPPFSNVYVGNTALGPVQGLQGAVFTNCFFCGKPLESYSVLFGEGLHAVNYSVHVDCAKEIAEKLTSFLPAAENYIEEHKV